MKVGVPKEVKNHEYRVAITPDRRARARPRTATRCYVEKGAGRRLADRRRASTSRRAPRSSTRADEVWGTADMVLKVKEPVAEEYHRMREGLTLFTYLHLAADKPLTEELVKRKVTAHRLRDRAAARRARCRCSTRCPRSPAAWRRRSARTR